MESNYNGLLRGKNAIITGCNRGIGKSILTVFAENGANVWACIRKPDADFDLFIRELADKNNVVITTVCFDLADEMQIINGVKQIFAEKKSIDVLVNNAGAMLQSRNFIMTSISSMKEIFDINFFAPIQIMQMVARKMIVNKKGCIINIASIAAIDADHGQLEYISSKAALAVGTKKIARELSSYGIRANVIAPGLTDTDMLSTLTQEAMDKMISRNITGRVAKTDEIANAVLFLATDLSSYINGQVIRVDGGF